jgi:hypothetical protein
LVSEGWRELDERLARIIAHLPGSRDCTLESKWPGQRGMSAVHCISAATKPAPWRTTTPTASEWRQTAPDGQIT